MTTASTLRMSKPESPASATAWANIAMLDAPFHCRSVVREVPADVAPGHRAEDGVRDRVRQHIGVGVPRQPLLGRDRHAAEDERPSVNQPVQVVPRSDTCAREADARPAMASAALRSVMVVIFRFVGSPATILT